MSDNLNDIRNKNIRISLIFGKSVLALAVIMIIVAYLSPRTLSIRSTIVIKSDAEQVFSIIKSPESFVKWNPWAKYDTAVVFKAEKSKADIIDKISWTSTNNYELYGCLEYNRAEQSYFQQIKADFGKQGSGIIEFRSMISEPNRTLLVLEYHTDFGWNPMTRLYGITARWYMKDDWDLALLKLKNLIENESNKKSKPVILPEVNTNLDNLACYVIE